MRWEPSGRSDGGQTWRQAGQPPRRSPPRRTRNTSVGSIIPLPSPDTDTSHTCAVNWAHCAVVRLTGELARRGSRRRAAPCGSARSPSRGADPVRMVRPTNGPGAWICMRHPTRCALEEAVSQSPSGPHLRLREATHPYSRLRSLRQSPLQRSSAAPQPTPPRRWRGQGARELFLGLRRGLASAP
jgi:hypothetical protein